MRPRVGTYRWQLTPDSGFAAAAAAVDDLAAIGISHLYLSPVAEAVAGSTHGYDAVDPTRVRDELGGPAGLAALADRCDEAGLGLLVDIVPNHLAAASANPWWWDVLRLGQRSRWAEVFDIDWDPPLAARAGTILLPILGDHYGRELEAGRIRVERGHGEGRDLVVRYGDVTLPLAPATGADLDATVDELHADVDRLDALLAGQHYRLARWQVGGAEVGYRRFFDVDSLVATRVERDPVFDLLHRLPLELVASGTVDGLRIDHVDGLRDPQGYLDRLRAAAGPDVWLVVEKILRSDEELPASWPVAGTTGYEVADLLGGWLTDPVGATELTDGWRARTGEERTYEAVALEARRQVLVGSLAADVERVVAALARVCEERRRHRDHSRLALRDAVVEVAVNAPAYRSYVRAPGGAGAADEAFVAAAVDGTRRGDAGRRIEGDLLDLLGDVLLGRLTGAAEAEVALRFQQLTGPVAAKGEEDTAVYRWSPLPHRGEVGADPGRPTVAADAWHDACRRAQDRWPERLTTLSTHDTKRAADVRARLAALTTVAGDALAAFDRWWLGLAAAAGDRVDPASGWLVFCSLVGAHPLPFDRAWPVVEKSVREAKVRTSWTAPDEAFESALRSFVAAAVDDDAEVAALVALVAEAGDAAALAQLAAQLLAPGVPDVYQGGEGWERSLVDPDNRRPVDAERRRALLAAADRVDAATSWRDAEVRATGLPRLHVLRAGLALRRRHPAAFGPGPAGAYVSLPATRSDAERVLAFGRGDPVAAAVVVARPGPGARLAADAAVSLPAGRWTDVLTGERHDGRPGDGGGVHLAALHRSFPVTLLEATP